MSEDPGYIRADRQMATNGELLRCTLEISVPFRMLELNQQGGPRERDWQEAIAFGDIAAYEGDNLLFKGHKKGDTARVMTGLIRALAVMAFVPGGVTAWGLHFDVGTPDSTGAVHCSTMLRRML